MSEGKRMKGPGLKIVLLYNLRERLEMGEKKDQLAEAAVLEEIEAVERAVRSLGYQCFVMTLRDEVFTIIHWLREIQPDVVFNLCESVYDKTDMEMNIPALLDLMQIPYTGSPPLTLGLCQNKGRVKDILLSWSIQTPRYQIYHRPLAQRKEIAYPLIVKPLHEDGSLGITRNSVVLDDQALRRQVRYILDTYRQPALVEEFIDGRELNVGLIEFNGKVEALPVSEIDYSSLPEDLPRICGYEAKWVPESLEYQRSKPVCPAHVESGLRKKLEWTAIRVYQLFECRDYARVDMRVDREGNVHVIEVNPNPDISPQSGMARAIKAKGLTYADFVKGLVEKALERSG